MILSHPVYSKLPHLWTLITLGVPCSRDKKTQLCPGRKGKNLDMFLHMRPFFQLHFGNRIDHSFLIQIIFSSQIQWFKWQTAQNTEQRGSWEGPFRATMSSTTFVLMQQRQSLTQNFATIIYFMHSYNEDTKLIKSLKTHQNCIL